MRRALALLLVLLAPSLAVLAPTGPAAAATPPGFSDTTVLSLASPTSMDWTPDGRMLLTQDSGQLRVARGGTLLPEPALDLSARLCTFGERGLAGLLVDPDFAANHWVYLYWTHNAHDSCGEGDPATTPVNRVTRHTLGDDDRVDPASERVIVDHLPSPATNHNGGDLHMGADGLLYVTVGDGGCKIGDPGRCAAENPNSRRLDLPLGKVLRVTPTGGVPAANPYVGAAGARRCTDPAGVSPGAGPCTETYASGLRNPFRMGQRPGTSSFFVNDVGQGTWEEIDVLAKGRDYGWNEREGHCATGSRTDCGPSRFADPIFDYPHDNGCVSITGGAFVPTGLWPAPYSGSYLFADYVCGKVWRLAPKDGGGFTAEPFLTGLASPVHLEFGPYRGTQALYYLSYDAGQVHRVVRTSGNTAPDAAFSSRPDGRAVTFDGSASTDPDGDGLRSWRWDFGDGSTVTTSTPRTSHTYARSRTFTATLRVVDAKGAVSVPVRHPVLAGEHPPTIGITSPSAQARFAVGQRVTVEAAARDPEDGALPGSAITWTVRKRHDAHTHPFLGPVAGRSISLTFPQPEDLAATRTSYLEVTAVATDSRGLTTTVVRRLQPRLVDVTVRTSPGGGDVVVNGVRRGAPWTLTSWAGWRLQLAVPSPQRIDGQAHVFRRWSDGGDRVHEVRTPGSPTTYTAVLAPR
ncbi:MAG TPA: PQQ-dependent sugar dehydrogenase [Mycobacteriales bacterium]|nr:PQQ-dependent sugar dehydrogenase [Mycobacteriales bacterium]